MEPRYCVVIPTFDNPRTIRDVVAACRAHVDDIVVVDDGSGPEAAAVLEALESEGSILLERRQDNGGKGAAVKRGLRRALAEGFTHAVQVDADGQHAAEDLPKMIAASRDAPEALVLGEPVFDETAPRSRMIARKLSVFWAHVESGSRMIGDPLCGFRVYPLQAAVAAEPPSDRMDFDPEIAVRMLWAGTPIINVPTRVRYLPAEAGGVSHFRMVRDNAAISWMHTRLMLTVIGRALRGRHPWPQK